MAFKPIDPKRDEFRRYLERSGVIEALTKVFVRIVKERPENPLDYLRQNLGDSLHQADSMAYLQSELEEARIEIQRLRGIIESVNPDALREQLPREEVGKNSDDETVGNKKESIDSIPKQQEEPESAATAENRIPLVDTSQGNENQTDDLDKNIETPEDTLSTNNPMPANAAQNIDNSS